MIGTQTNANIKGENVATPSERNDTTVRRGRMKAAVYFMEMGEWGNGGMGEWGNGEMGEWGNGEMGKCEVIKKVNSNELKWKQMNPNIKMH